MRAATRKKVEPALVVFARAPVPGRVKTRLIPMLGKQGAAELYARMLAKTLRTAKAARFDPQLLLASAQGPGDLGARMHRACARALKRREGVVLIGSDCPCMKPSDLRAAARALRSGFDAVFSPAEDGGYALVGLRRSDRRLFRGVDWGGPKVMEQTRGRLRELGWRWKELRTLWDVDRPADVRRLRKGRLL